MVQESILDLSKIAVSDMVMEVSFKFKGGHGVVRKEVYDITKGNQLFLIVNADSELSAWDFMG